MKRTYTVAAAALAMLAAAPTTAAGVAEMFGFPPRSFAFNDATGAEALQQRLVDLAARADGIHALARTEERDVTEEELGQIEAIHAEFEATEARLAMAQPRARTQPPGAGQRQEPAAVRNSVPVAPGARREDPGTDRRMGVLLSAATAQRASAAMFGPSRDGKVWANDGELDRHDKNWV